MDYQVIDYPTVPGLYWYRSTSSTSETWKYAEAHIIEGVGLCMDIYGNTRWPLYGLANTYEFRGPIPPPSS